MAKSRNPDELLDAWRGWHAIAPPMKPKYARFVELSNKGAREMGFKRHRRDVAIEIRHAGRRFRRRDGTAVAAGQAALRRAARTRPRDAREEVWRKVVLRDGPIPAHLLGNMWAQQWGNIYPLLGVPARGTAATI